MTNVAKRRWSPLKVITAIVAVIVVVLFITAASQIREVAQGHSIDYDSRDYLYSAETNRFGRLYDTTVRDMEKRASYSSEVAECRALAFYYEQAVLEHAYRTTGDTAKADEFAQRMEEYEAELGSLAPKAEAVRKAVSG